MSEYPLDTGLYDSAVARGVFKPKRPEHYEPRLIGRFNSACFDHYHYEDGRSPSGGEIPD